MKNKLKRIDLNYTVYLASLHLCDFARKIFITPSRKESKFFSFLKIHLLIIGIFIFHNSITFANVHLGSDQQYKNIEAAWSAGAILPGDTVFLHKGSFAGYQGISKLKGEASNWIVITRFQNDSIDISGCWQFTSCEYIKLQKLNFKANKTFPGRLINVDNGGNCETQAKYITFDNCYFSDVTDVNAICAFKFGGVDNFEVTNCVFKDISGCGAMDYNVCHNGLIKGNRLENCLTGGHIKGGASNITMEANLFINASQASWVAFELGGDTGAQFYCPGDNFEVKNLKFYSNIIVGGYRGLALSSAVDCKVVNNTFYNCGQATLRFLTTSSLYPKLSDNIVKNNIFSFGQSAYINGSAQDSAAATLSNNIYHGIITKDFTGPYWDTPELNSIKEKEMKIFGSSTLMYVDAAKNDFHLNGKSPAIGSGVATDEPIYDFYSNKFASERSIGAIQYIDSTTGVTDVQIDEITLFPNPCRNELNILLPYAKALATLYIYNSLGQQVYSDFITNNIEQINITDFSDGVYYLVLKYGDGTGYTRSFSIIK
ncbi:MAG: hypothetical protein HW421_413 [Ignavibacteria bacterium]|nr:hypothetical protein [Ignavibacteria bacterium]